MNLKLDKMKEDNEEYASFVQEFIATVFAPELLTYEGRIILLVFWFVLTSCMSYAALNVEVNFSQEFFIPGTP